MSVRNPLDPNEVQTVLELLLRGSHTTGDVKARARNVINAQKSKIEDLERKIAEAVKGLTKK